MGMPALRMRHRQPAHPFRQVAVPARPDDQVPMIGQETIGQEPHRQPIEGRAQDALKGGIVFRLLKDPGAAHRSIEDMVDESTGSDTQASWHALKLICPLALVKMALSRDYQQASSGTIASM